MPSAKISPPQIPRDTYERVRLYELLDARLEVGGLWVEGPVGAGKTTLAASYLREYAGRVVWYRFDGRDRDAGPLFFYLSQAVGEPRERLPVPISESQVAVEDFAHVFFEHFKDCLVSFGQTRRPVVVFDDVHHVAPGSSLFSVLSVALSEFGDAVRVIFLSREVIPSELASFLADRRLSIIDWNDLRLHRDESDAIVSSLLKGKDISEDVRRRLSACSQGWVAGLVLLCESCRGDMAADEVDTLPAGLRGYFRFVFETCLTNEVREFLVRSALLPIMTGRMASQLTGCSEAERILADLYRRHFFVEARNTEETVYLYHDLFRGFLLSVGDEILADEVKERLLMESGHLLREEGFIELAADQYIEAGDWEALARLAKDVARDLLNQGRYRPLSIWFEALPERIVEADPWLCHWKAAARLHSDPWTAREGFKMAYQGFERHDDLLGQCLAWSSVVETTCVVWEFRSSREWI